MYIISPAMFQHLYGFKNNRMGGAANTWLVAIYLGPWRGPWSGSCMPTMATAVTPGVRERLKTLYEMCQLLVKQIAAGKLA